MKSLYIFWLLLLSSVADSQQLLKGVLLNELKNPVTRALVFLNGTTVCTSVNEHGEFVLKIPNGKYVLVVSAAGFETHNEFINSGALPVSVTVSLKTKSESQNSIESGGENAWNKWGFFFMANFLGSAANSEKCRIKNIKAVHFKYSDEAQELSATADEPLIIENKALGYSIQYQLEKFQCNFKTQVFNYTGYSFFQPMSGNTTKQQKWEEKRSEKYFGSMMHFMRSVYLNRIAEEGFEVRSLRKEKNIPSYHQDKTDPGNSVFTRTPAAVQTILSGNADSSNYNDQIINADNYKDIIGTTLIGDSIAYAIDSVTAGLYFDNFLLVIYKAREAPVDYQEQYGSTGMTSQLVLVNKRPIEIESNGSYYNTSDLLVLGYWIWSEKMANLLPYDYNPPKQ